MKKVIILILMFVSSFSVLAIEFNCTDVKKEVIASEVVKLELYGLRISDRFTCLKQDAFKYIKARFEPPEEGYRRFEVGVDASTLKILRLEKIDEESGQYYAHFEVRASERFGGELIQDKVHMIIHPSKRIQTLEGCGDSLFGPEKFYLAKQCYE